MTAPQADRIAKALERLVGATERVADSLEHQELRGYAAEAERQEADARYAAQVRAVQPVPPSPRPPFWRRWMR